MGTRTRRVTVVVVVKITWEAKWKQRDAVVVVVVVVVSKGGKTRARAAHVVADDATGVCIFHLASDNNER